MKTNKEKKKISKAQQNAVRRYNDKAYEHINLTIRKGNKDIIKRRAAETGQSVNGYINGLIANDISDYIIMDGSTGGADR